LQKKKKKGTKTAYSAALIPKVMSWGKKGFMPSEMAALAGVTTRTWVTWQEKYPGFATACQLALQYSEHFVMDACRRRLGEGSDTLIKFLLSSKFGYAEKSTMEVIGDSKVEVSFASLKKPKQVPTVE